MEAAANAEVVLLEGTLGPVAIERLRVAAGMILS